jgi:hypothetical protein
VVAVKVLVHFDSVNHIMATISYGDDVYPLYKSFKQNENGPPFKKV